MAALECSRRVGVIGAGAMGAGIAQVAAAAGHPVLLYDAMDGAAEAGRKRIVEGLDGLVSRGRLAREDAEALSARIEVVCSLNEFADVALVVEAIVERLDVKRDVLTNLEEIVAADAILATNTSSLSITSIARDTKIAGRVAGMHFFNPAPVMKLVEIVSGLATDPQVANTLFDTARAWGKVAVHAKSTPGFIVNRVARSFYGESLRLYEEQVADIATLDALLTGGGGFRMGPFELMDLVGNDVNHAVSVSIYEAFYQEPRFRPSIVQMELVNAGRFGRKTGQGHFSYAKGAVKPAPAAEPKSNAVPIDGFHLGGEVEMDGVRIVQTDGRTAAMVAREARKPVIVYDLTGSSCSRVAFAATPDVRATAVSRFVATLQAQNVEATLLPDWPGLVVMRIVSMLANEGFEAVLQGVADADGVDAAMRYGVNYPRGPIEWAREIGLSRVVSVLDTIQTLTGDPRYRASLGLRMASDDATLHAFAADR
jgi:3-hydroxybutyryl-CoA dehydrogenase